VLDSTKAYFPEKWINPLLYGGSGTPQASSGGFALTGFAKMAASLAAINNRIP